MFINLSNSCVDIITLHLDSSDAQNHLYDEKLLSAARSHQALL